MIGLLIGKNGFVEVEFFIFDNKILIIYPEDCYFAIKKDQLEIFKCKQLFNNSFGEIAQW